MSKALCLIHANCQGDELESLLLASSAFRAIYRTERYTSYTRELIPEDSLNSCSLFIYQYLGPSWGDFASNTLLAGLPEAASSLCIPSLFFNGCWPLWTSASPMDFGDSLLDRLIEEKASKGAILNIYLNKDLSSFVDMDAVFENSLQRERAEEERTVVPTLDWILKHWKERPLFHTVNHPGRELMTRVANGILQALGLPLLTDNELAVLPKPFPSYADFDLPVHPAVAAHHGLHWVFPGKKYNIFGREMTFEQYVSRYIDCRMNGYEDNFLGYLQLV